MLSRYIAAPFIAGTGIALGLTLLVGSSYAIWIIPQVVVLAAIYVLSPQIDWWYFKKNPQVMPEGMTRILEKFYPYYKALKPELKPHFRNRLMMYLRCVEFIGKPEKEVPEDIMMIVAAAVTQLTFGLEDYRLSKFERIVIYPHPFPSPQYKEHVHNSEIFEEDGVLLFSVEPLLAAFRFPHKYYNQLSQ